MEFDDIRIEPVLLDDIIPAEVFYDRYDPDQIIKIDQESLEQINLAEFNHLIEEVRDFLEINID